MGRRLLPASVVAAALVLAAAGSAQTAQGMTVHSLASSPAAPDTVYAGTSDGVYKSTNFGTTWRRSSNGLPDDADRVAVDPQNQQRVYATADGGVWRSDDGGRQWRLRSQALKQMGVYRMFVAPSAPATVYVIIGGFQRPALWRSTNAGASWRRVPGTLPMAEPVLAVDPFSPNRLYLGSAGTAIKGKFVLGDVFLSVDGGRTWRRRVSKTDIHSLVVDPAAATVYAGSATGEIHRSADRGEHWRTVARLAAKQWVVNLAVDPSDPGVVYALTAWGIHRSVNGGVSWRLIDARNVPGIPLFSAGSGATLVIHPADSDRMLLLTDSLASRVWRSSDRGRSWRATSLVDGARAAQLDDSS